MRGARGACHLVAEAVEGEAEVLQRGVVLERARNVPRAVGADAVALQLQLDLRPPGARDEPLHGLPVGVGGWVRLGFRGVIKTKSAGAAWSVARPQDEKLVCTGGELCSPESCFA